MQIIEIAEYIGAITTIVAAIRWLLQKAGRFPDLTSVPGVTHSLSHEIAAVVPVAVLLNIAGALLAIYDPSIFLDMVGTLLASILLGPWWGALIGVLSGMTMQWLVATIPIDTKLDFLPFTMVQITGAFYWGTVSRLKIARPALSSASEDLGSLVRSICVLGIGGGIVTGLTSAWVYNVVVSGAHPSAELSLSLVSQFFAPNVIFVEIAGKICSVVIAAMLVRALFPIFLRASTHHLARSGILPIAGMAFACGIYALSLLGSLNLAFDAVPMLVVLVAAWPIGVPLLFLPSELGVGRMATDLSQARADRVTLYARLNEVAQPSDQAFRAAALISVLVAFLAVLLGGEASAGRGFVLRLASVIGFLLLVAWSLDVAARHNRLDQILIKEEAAPVDTPI